MSHQRRSALWDITRHHRLGGHHGALHPGSQLLRVARRGDGGAAGDARVRRDAEHRHQRRPRARRDHRARPRAGLADLRQARRPARHAQRRRRAAPLRLERVLVGALPVGRAPARRAALPARARPALLAHPRHRRQGRPARARSSSRSIEAEEIARKAGYSRPHTIHCGPDGIYVSALGNPEGDGPGGMFLLDHDDFSRQGPVGGRPRAAGARLRLLVAPQPRHGDHVRVGDAEHGRGRARRRAAARQQVRPQAARLGPRRRASTCRRSTSARSTRWCSSCGPRTTRPRATASSASSRRPPTCRRRSGCGRAPRTARCRAEKVITIPAEPAEAEQLPPLLQPFGAVPPLITDIALSVDDRSLYVSCWGTGELKRFDVSDPRAPRETGSVRLGGIVGRAPHPAAGRAQRRAADGRGLARRPPRRSSPTRSTPPGTRSSTPRASTAGWSSSTRARTARSRSTRTCSSSTSGERPHQVRLAGRRRVLGLLLLPGSLMDTLWPWVLMALLGAYHGLNPAMGWLFAVALGMQERDRRAVLRALPPIALGHEASVVLAAALVLGLGLLADTSVLHMGAGIALVVFGDLPLRQAARALPLGQGARDARRARVVVVPDVDRPRRGADGRAGAARRGRGRRRPRRRTTRWPPWRSTACRSPAAASRCSCTSARWSP